MQRTHFLIGVLYILILNELSFNKIINKKKVIFSVCNKNDNLNILTCNCCLWVFVCCMFF